MSASDESAAMRQCPFCKEEVLAEAVRCKHCHATIPAVRSGHQGACPYCKETIHREAVRCKHCHANLTGDCGCGQGTSAPVTHAAPNRAGASVRHKALARPARVDVARERFPSYPDPVPGCAATDKDEDGLWCFIEASEHYCLYELCVPAVGPTLPA